MAYKPRYEVRAGRYVGRFELELEPLLRFLAKFKPDPCWGAEESVVVDLETGEEVARVPVPESGYSAYE